MPKKRWSALDERKYKAIVKSCKLSRGRKKGATRICKRIAAATVERDRGIAELGLGGPRSIPARGMGAQLLSVGLGDRWQRGDRDLKSGAWFKKKGGRQAVLSDADDTLAPPGRGDVFLTVTEDDQEIVSDYFPSIAEAEAVTRRHGLEGLGACGCSSSPTTTSLAGRKRKRKR